MAICPSGAAETSRETKADVPTNKYQLSSISQLVRGAHAYKDSTNSTKELDPSLWSDLPLEIKMQIIKFWAIIDFTCHHEMIDITFSETRIDAEEFTTGHSDLAKLLRVVLKQYSDVTLKVFEKEMPRDPRHFADELMPVIVKGLSSRLAEITVLEYKVTRKFTNEVLRGLFKYLSNIRHVRFHSTDMIEMDGYQYHDMGYLADMDDKAHVQYVIKSDTQFALERLLPRWNATSRELCVEMVDMDLDASVECYYCDTMYHKRFQVGKFAWPFRMLIVTECQYEVASCAQR